MTYDKDILIEDWKEFTLGLSKGVSPFMFDSIENMSYAQLETYIDSFREWLTSEKYKMKDITKKVETYIKELTIEKERIEMEKLLPCPMCGAEAKVVEIVDAGENDRNKWSIGCNTPNCFCDFIYSPHFSSKSEAIRLWNSRVGDKIEEE
jgi:hypothetical protein